MQLEKTKTLNINGTSSLNSSLMELPISKHLNLSGLSDKVDTFRKGEKNIFWFLKLAGFGALAYAFFVYALPPLMVMLGATIGAILSVLAVVLTVICAPAILRGMRTLARWLHKQAINRDPFLQLEIEKAKMIKNRDEFRLAKANIFQIKGDMENEAAKAQKDAEELQKEVVKKFAKAEALKKEMADMIAKDGVSARTTDEYVNANSELLKRISEADQMSHRLTQAKNFITKYGSRAVIMKKFNQKLIMVETAMDIKISDFDTSIDILKKDYDYANKTRKATETAKNAMLFSKSWELEYALDVVTEKIAEDIAITSGNLKDIDSLSQYALDSDDLYTNLELLTNNIKVNADVIPSAKQYSDPEYKLTAADRQASGGLDNVF